MNIIKQFDDYSGIIETGSGYGDICQVDRDRLIELVSRLPAGSLLLTSVPHDKGRAVMLKPITEKRPLWHVLSPTFERKPKKKDEGKEPGLFRMRK